MCILPYKQSLLRIQGRITDREIQCMINYANLTKNNFHFSNLVENVEIQLFIIRSMLKTIQLKSTSQLCNWKWHDQNEHSRNKLKFKYLNFETLSCRTHKEKFRNLVKSESK